MNGEARAAEVGALVEAQAADDATTKPKALLKVPRGAKTRKGKKLDIQGPNGEHLNDALDTTPPPGLDF